MTIKCIIIDDEPLAISVIENHLKNFDNIEIVETFNNPLKAFGVLQQEKIDLVLNSIKYFSISIYCKVFWESVASGS